MLSASGGWFGTRRAGDEQQCESSNKYRYESNHTGKPGCSRRVKKLDPEACHVMNHLVLRHKWVSKSTPSTAAVESRLTSAVMHLDWEGWLSCMPSRLWIDDSQRAVLPHVHSIVSWLCNTLTASQQSPRLSVRQDPQQSQPDDQTPT